VSTIDQEAFERAQSARRLRDRITHALGAVTIALSDIVYSGDEVVTDALDRLRLVQDELLRLSEDVKKVHKERMEKP